MARFLTDNDYETLIRDEIKDVLLEDYNEQKILTGENMAIAQIKNFLSGYDIDLIFQGYAVLPDPDPRDCYIIMLTIDCALYHLYSSVAPNRIPQLRAERYGDALDWLRKVSKGETTANLPRLKDDEGNAKTEVRIGSKYKVENNKW